MANEPKHQPVVPAYGVASLADLSESLLASLGATADNTLELPPARRICLLIVDGLGWEALRNHQAAAPFLSELAFNGRPLSCGFPSTTVASLGSIGTGRPPGEHGLLGYQVLNPENGKLLNGLRWDPKVDPAQWQPLPTIFERAAAAGIATGHVAQALLGNTGLSRAVFRSARFWPANSLGALVAVTSAALHSAEPTLVTVYHGDLDGAGHEFGVASDAWYYQLAHVDKLAEQIASVLPANAVLYVTADHGMVDVADQDRIDADEVAELRDGVAVLGGEPRARHVYARQGAAADVLATWREVLGDKAWVVPRDEAIRDGWFGPVDEANVARIGDVVAAMSAGYAVIASNAEPRESRLVGMHGSLTSAEQLIPILAFSSV
jgi:Type I phosphodiesterase / nucleotide pyrophosphatase